jgi:hypothetical protein
MQAINQQQAISDQQLELQQVRRLSRLEETQVAQQLRSCQQGRVAYTQDTSRWVFSPYLHIAVKRFGLQRRLISTYFLESSVVKIMHNLEGPC